MTFQSAPEKANLGLALAISILLHVLLLWPSPLPQGGGLVAPLSASLRPVPAPPAVPTRDRPPMPAAPRPRADLPSAPERPIDAGESPSAATPGLTTKATLRSGTAGSDADRMNGDGATASAAPDAGSIDADGVRQYRIALSREARRFKRYPARALEAGVAGTVEIHVGVTAGGMAENVRLARSSGDANLDAAALEMIGRAAPRTAVPDALRSRAFAVNLPVVFDLASD